MRNKQCVERRDALEDIPLFPLAKRCVLNLFELTASAGGGESGT